VNVPSRRLQRFLGSRRKNPSRCKGGIETVQPGQISGWVIAADVSIHEVRLLVGTHLIARADVNQPRSDVCQVHGCSGHPGFKLQIPADLPPVDWQLRPRLIALSSDASQQFELSLLDQPHQTSDLLLSLLRSDLLGTTGHFDGLIDGHIVGWAAKSGQQQPVRIWLQTVGRDAKEIVCQQWREGMKGQDLPERCGFRVDINSLPDDWQGCHIWCSFDRQNRFQLPQIQEVTLPSRGHLKTAIDADVAHPTHRLNSLDSPYEAIILSAPADFREHWQTVETFRRYLDQLEAELDAKEAPAVEVGSRRQGRHWWQRLLGSGS
jgi:hypothetical protein